MASRTVPGFCFLPVFGPEYFTANTVDVLTSLRQKRNRVFGRTENLQEETEITEDWIPDLRFLCFLLLEVSYRPRSSRALRNGALETLIMPLSG